MYTLLMESRIGRKFEDYGAAACVENNTRHIVNGLQLRRTMR